MKKVKLKLSHTTITELADSLQTLADNITPATRLEKMRNALWIEVWLILQKEAAWKFKGEKKISLSVPRALALLEGMCRLKPEEEYLSIMYLEIIKFIDQQTV